MSNQKPFNVGVKKLCNGGFRYHLLNDGPNNRIEWPFVLSMLRGKIESDLNIIEYLFSMAFKTRILDVLIINKLKDKITYNIHLNNNPNKTTELFMDFCQNIGDDGLLITFILYNLYMDIYSHKYKFIHKRYTDDILYAKISKWIDMTTIQELILLYKNTVFRFYRQEHTPIQTNKEQLTQKKRNLEYMEVPCKKRCLDKSMNICTKILKILIDELKADLKTWENDTCIMLRKVISYSLENRTKKEIYFKILLEQPNADEYTIDSLTIVYEELNSNIIIQDF